MVWDVGQARVGGDGGAQREVVDALPSDVLYAGQRTRYLRGAACAVSAGWRVRRGTA